MRAIRRSAARSRAFAVFIHPARQYSGCPRFWVGAGASAWRLACLRNRAGSRVVGHRGQIRCRRSSKPRRPLPGRSGAGLASRPHRRALLLHPAGHSLAGDLPVAVRRGTLQGSPSASVLQRPPVGFDRCRPSSISSPRRLPRMPLTSREVPSAAASRSARLRARSRARTAAVRSHRGGGAPEASRRPAWAGRRRAGGSGTVERALSRRSCGEHGATTGHGQGAPLEAGQHAAQRVSIRARAPFEPYAPRGPGLGW